MTETDDHESTLRGPEPAAVYREGIERPRAAAVSRRPPEAGYGVACVTKTSAGFDVSVATKNGTNVFPVCARPS